MTTITLATLPERVDLTDRLIVEHDDRIVGNIQPGATGGVVAYCELNDTLGGGETTREALDWLRKMVATNLKTVIAEPVAITEPGLYDLPAAVYHGDPVPSGSLSQSRAKRLLTEGGPAKFHHYETAPRVEKAEFDLGTTAHALALGKGEERLVVVSYDTYASKPAKEMRDQAYAAGKTPIKAKDLRIAEAMAEELGKHSHAMAALDGQHEVAMFWPDEDGLWLRGQMDTYAPGSHIGDYKTAADASGAGFIRSAWNFRYHMQGAWYRRLVQMLTGEKLPYRIVAQETTAPFLVSVWEIPEDYLQLGYADMADAIELYKQCRRTGEWPGYPLEAQTLTPPDWAIDDEIEF